MQSDWEASAEAWIESLGAGGDFSRAAVLDRSMMAAVRQSGNSWRWMWAAAKGGFAG